MPIGRWSAMGGSLSLACALGLMPSPARADAQDERIKALETRLDSSAKLIEQLSNRISELEQAARTSAQRAAPAEARAAAPPTNPSATTAPDRQGQAVAALQEEVQQISEGLSKRGFDTGLPVHGFADVLGGWSAGGDPQKLRGFNAGTLDLYLTPEIGDRVRTLVEIAVEYDPDGASTVDMERLQLGYTVSNALTVWAGRFHTPFGLWNTSFHHGANLQTSIYRPRFIDFEDKGGIIPAHSVGLWFTGKTPLGDAKVSYDAYVSNGPTVRHRQLDFNPFTDDGAGKMVGFNLGYIPDGELHGLTVGIHGFASTVKNVSTTDATLGSTRVLMGGGYAGYEANDWESFAEYYRFADKDRLAPSATLSSTAWFVHIGRTWGRLTPFVRFERASLDPKDNFFLSQQTGRSYRRAVAGARYALDARSSVKLELSASDEAAARLLDETGQVVTVPGSRYNRAAIQYSIAF